MAREEKKEEPKSSVQNVKWDRGFSVYPMFREYIPCPWGFRDREDPAHMLLKAGCEELYREGIFTLAL